ncbi:hypothetical protein ACFQZT_25775 [Paenibacillus sp. GCM10027628]|uniref:hypothetical protein n=1 Tax=Paenibacillus sp. GCM10027628 TaxID=3273413 RepID=UPI00363FF971
MRNLKYDLWLDEFNDNIRLYEMFGDFEYLQQAEEVFKELRSVINKRVEYEIFVRQLDSIKISLFLK